jgi:hypothetical protein
MASSDKPAQEAPVQQGTDVDPSRVLPHDPYGHGHSIAAWTAVTVVMIGALILSFGVGFTNLPLSIIGGVIALLGGPVGKLLGALGLGSSHGSTR